MDNRFQQYFLFALLIGTFIVTAFIFWPYLTAIIIALVCSVLFRPVHSMVVRITAKGNEQSTVSTLFTIGLIAILILTPLAFIANQVSSEAQQVYLYLTDEGNRANIITFLNDTVQTVSRHFLGYYPNISFDTLDVTTQAQKLLRWSFTNINSIFGGVVFAGINLFIFLLALFYFLRDGAAFKRQLIAMSPLLDMYDERIFTKVDTAIHSIVRGSLVIGLIQGILTGVGFWVAGIPNPALWGSVAAIAAFIPGVGTSLVLGPGIIYLFITGSTVAAIGLLAWAVFAVGLIDNFLSAHLVQRGVAVHPFIILLSVLGGLAFFGPIGFILGPLVIAFLIALLDIYRESYGVR